MRALLNTWTATAALTGVGHYTSELLRCLLAQAGPDAIRPCPTGLPRLALAALRRLRQFVNQRRARRSRPAGAGGPAGPPAPSRLGQIGRACYARLLEAAGRDCDLYHEPNFLPLPLRREVPVVTTVHDLSVLLRPEWHPGDRVAFFERHFQAGLARSSHLLAISESARQEIIKALGVRPERVTRTYMGVRAGLRPLPPAEVAAGLRRLRLPERYLLHLGTLEPRKNVLTLLRAWCALPGPVRERHPLVLVGGWGWSSGEVAGYLDREARPKGARHLGYLPDEALPVLYNGARALCFPSYYEGFGLPPVEMLACGGAVLASTAAAVAETAGARACLIDPDDLDGWRSALLRVCTDDDWWASLRRGAVEAARPYTWEQCAADTLAVYHAVAGGGRRAAA